MKLVALTLAIVAAILGLAARNTDIIALVALVLLAWLAALAVKYVVSSLEIFHGKDHEEEAEARAELARLDNLPD